MPKPFGVSIQPRVRMHVSDVMAVEERAVRRTLFRLGGLTRTVAKRSMRKRKRGSARPGQPPLAHVPSSRGLRNIRFEVDERDRTVAVVTVRFGTRVEVPALMELGGRTRTGERYAARPFMEPAMVTVVPEGPAIYRESFERAAGRGRRRRR